MRIGYVEWPVELEPTRAALAPLRVISEAARLDLLVANELPFGPWLAGSPGFSIEAAKHSVEAHARGLKLLAEWRVPAILTSRPVWRGDRLANQAVAIEQGRVRGLHAKQYFPSEAGWHEDAWFVADGGGFEAASILGLRVGVLLCTEAMFPELARGYGRQGAVLIVVPRASGVTVRTWRIACAMAAIASGAYVVSSNRVGRASGGPEFGGQGLAYAPGGDFIGSTDRSSPLGVLEMDLAKVARAQGEYPCYVRGP